MNSYYKGRKVLITGGASFIGSHLTELLVQLGASVSVVDNLSSGRLENLSNVIKEIDFANQDLRSPEVAMGACKGKDVVFHLAAFHGGRGFIDTHPVGCIGNVVLDHAVLRAAGEQGVQRVVFASSACVYPTNLQASENGRGLLNESCAGFDEPGSAFADGEYGWAKLMGEYQLAAVQKEFGIEPVACRIFTAYGERENETHAVIALIAKALAKLDPFRIWGTGLQTRNFTYVEDTVKGLALAGAAGSKGNHKGVLTLNVGTSKHHTILDLVEEIFKCLAWHPKNIKFETDKPAGVGNRASDNSKIRSLFGWEPQIAIADGIAKTARWYAASPRIASLGNLQNLLMGK